MLAVGPSSLPRGYSSFSPSMSLAVRSLNRYSLTGRPDHLIRDKNIIIILIRQSAFPEGGDYSKILSGHIVLFSVISIVYPVLLVNYLLLFQWINPYQPMRAVQIYLYILLTAFASVLFTPDARAQGEICDNGIDDDGDGLADCDDPDCTLFCPSTGPTEICGNGRDDDGDGFVDYYDADCVDAPDNPNDFLVNDADCEVLPQGNVFSLSLAWRSPDGSATAYGTPVVGDVDGDSIPEVIFGNQGSRTLSIVNGEFNGVGRNPVTHQVTLDAGTYLYPALSDVDSDGDGEIFVLDTRGNVYCFDHELNLVWQNGPSGQRSPHTNMGSFPALADFDEDGTPELYYQNEIRNAITGEILVRGSHGSSMYTHGNNWVSELTNMAVAVDILDDSECADCEGLELVLGAVVYSVNLATNTLTEELHMGDATYTQTQTNTRTPVNTSFNYRPIESFNNQNFTSTAVVDYDGDGNLDILTNGGNGGDRYSTLYFWNLATGEVRFYEVIDPGGGGGNYDDHNTWTRGVGSINVADIDGDGELEATFASAENLYALETDFTEKWINTDDFEEGSSGLTGTTVFDFNGDGSSEIVYRDEIDVYIVDGITGNVLNTSIPGQECRSQTQAEIPVVADIDNDGQTELVMSCYHPGGSAGGDRHGSIIAAYKADESTFWVPARPVWNQQGYFNVNINDDLTVPQFQQSHEISFAQICDDPTAPEVFPLNKFLNQSPRISFCGNLEFPSPRLDFYADGVTVTPPRCPEDSFSIRLQFENNGDDRINAPIPLALYNDNPAQAYNNSQPNPWVDTLLIDVPGGVAVGQQIDTTLFVRGGRGAFDLYVSLNDIGPFDRSGNSLDNNTFYPLDSLNGTIRECDGTPTVVSAEVNPFPFDITTDVLSVNTRCPGFGLGSNNGEAQVTDSIGNPFNASDFEVTWTQVATGNVVGSRSDFTVSQLDSGFYDVQVVSSLYGCGSEVERIYIDLDEDGPDSDTFNVFEINPLSSCAPGTADARAAVTLNGGAIPSGYTIEWSLEEDNTGTVIGVNDTLLNMENENYRVEVVNDITGCGSSQTIVPTLPPLPLIDNIAVTDITNCGPTPNSGINITLAGSATGIEFRVIREFGSQDTVTNNTGSFTGLPAGTYRVEAINTATRCSDSRTGIQIEDLSENPSLQGLDVVSENTACDPALNNGQLEVQIQDGTGPYTLRWYRGTNTLPGNLVDEQTGLAASTMISSIDTLGGNQQYSVEVIDALGCSAVSAPVTLPNNPEEPEILSGNIDFTDADRCDTPNGTITATVGAPGSETTAGYQFFLEQGGTRIDSQSDGTFTGLDDGLYTVIVYDSATGCFSNNTATSNVAIDNVGAFGNPVTANLTDIRPCNLSDADGNIDLLVNGSPNNAAFNYQWYRGLNASSGNLLAGETNSSLNAGARRNSSVVIINPANGCDTTVNYTLNRVVEPYRDSLNLVKLSDVTTCDPANFNGALRARLVRSSLGETPDTSIYRFRWYEGTTQDVENGVATPITSGLSDTTLTSLAPGTYTVTASENGTPNECIAINNQEIEVVDITANPVLALNFTPAENMSCDVSNPNGEIEITAVNSDDNIANYNFDWFVNSGGSPSAAGSGPVITGLRQGDYIVEVTDSLACVGDTTIRLEDNLPDPEDIRIIASASPVTQCNPANGAINVTSIEVFGNPEDVADYSYEWYEFDYRQRDSTLISGETTASLTGVDQNQYTVRATGINTNCPSVPVRVQVDRQPGLSPDFTFDADTLTDCVNPDGAIEVVLNSGVPADFSFQWYIGDDTVNTIAGETNPLIDDIRNDDYTVEVTNNATQCDTFATFNLPGELLPIPPPVLTVNPSTSCGTPNGSIQGEVEPAIRSSTYPSHNPDDFWYYWFEGDQVQYENGTTDFNDIDNYDPINDPTSGNNQSLLQNIDGGEYTVVIVDVRNYLISGNKDDIGCRSNPELDTITQEARSPLVSMNLSSNINCENPFYGTDFNGGAGLEAEKRTGDGTTNSGYTYEWFEGTGAGLQPGVVNTTDTLGNLGIAGGFDQYTIVVEDVQTECDTTVEVSIADQSTPPIVQTTATVEQTYCAPANGSAEVTALGNMANLADHEIFWYANSGDFNFNDPASGAIDGTFQADYSIDGLMFGEYYAVAANPNTGCISIPEAATVEEDTIAPVITLTEIIDNSVCDPSLGGNGSIAAEFSISEGGNFDYTWTPVADLSNVIDNGNTTDQTLLEDLEGDDYRVSVQSSATGCISAANYTVEDIPIYPDFLAGSATTAPIIDCIDPGTINVNEIQLGDTTLTRSDSEFANFQFTWYQETLDNNGELPGETAASLEVLDSEYTNGQYFIRVLNTATGCIDTTAFLDVNLDNNSTKPIFNTEDLEAYITCSDLNEGLIELSVTEDDLTTGSYAFNWFDASGNPVTTNVDSANFTSLQNIDGSQYRVQVENTVTGCVDSVEVQAPVQQAVPLLTAIKISDNTVCLPSNGAISVGEVNINNQLQDVAGINATPNGNGYRFTWYEGDLSNSFGTPEYGLDTDSIQADQLPPGTYFIVAEKRNAPDPGCVSDAVQVTIQDFSVLPRVFLDEEIAPVTACDPFEAEQSRIEVEVDYNLNPVVINWYRNEGIVPFETQTDELRNLTAGRYTIEVIDTLTNCRISNDYEVEAIETPLMVAASTEPLTSCISPDGLIAANITGGSGSFDNYEITWYEGNDASGTPIAGPGNRISTLETLNAGQYTLTVSDTTDETCGVIVTQANVEDQRNNIELAVDNDFVVTTCDMSNPNGQLSVMAADGNSNYQFFWYEGEDTDASPFAQGETAADLGPGLYSVVARDLFTGCLSQPYSGTVEMGEVSGLPAPVTALRSPQTSCLPTQPNGTAVAVPDSSLLQEGEDYQFFWYEGNEVSNEVYFTEIGDNVVENLDTGTYTVTYRNIITGCTSDPATVDVFEALSYPEFEIITTEAICLDNDGTALIELTSDTEISTTEWVTPIGARTQPYLRNMPPGIYTATLTDINGCQTTVTDTITTNLSPFNGISANGDNQNDYFIISCIEQFPENNVKIFNRAGALVYEADYYDNQDVFFEGKGNRGLYIGGQDLPEGTYFYVIDKQNGEDPVSGYLELTR